MMTIKETELWLERALATEEEIRILTQARDAALARCLAGSQSMTGSSSGGYGRNDARLEKYIRNAEMLKEAIERLDATKDEIFETLMRVPDTKLRTLLSDRYLNGKKWEQIAEDVSRDVRSVYRMKRRALEYVRELVSQA
ncbi:MAG: hypothetical protein HUJ65_01925 [Oscillospiraceae bacterium]|nr:hypothetical protein [Oscillospiraceae bacterium]